MCFKRRHTSGGSPTPASPTKRANTRTCPQITVSCEDDLPRTYNHHVLSENTPPPVDQVSPTLSPSSSKAPRRISSDACETQGRLLFPPREGNEPTASTPDHIKNGRARAGTNESRGTYSSADGSPLSIIQGPNTLNQKTHNTLGLPLRPRPSSRHKVNIPELVNQDLCLSVIEPKCVEVDGQDRHHDSRAKDVSENDVPIGQYTAEEVQRTKDRPAMLTSTNVATPRTPSDIEPFSSEDEYIYDASTNPYAALLAVSSPSGIAWTSSSPYLGEKPELVNNTVERDTVTYTNQVNEKSLEAIMQRLDSIEARLAVSDCHNLWCPGPSSQDGVRMVPHRTAELLVDDLGWGSRVLD